MKGIVNPPKEPPVSDDGRELGHGVHSETVLIFFLIQKKFYLKAEKLNQVNCRNCHPPLMDFPFLLTSSQALRKP